MSGADKLFAGSVPRVYEDLLVPLIFAGYAEDLADRVAARSPRSVLETAAGTGVVTRALARRLPQDACYAATDLNEPMLAVARERQGEDPRIGWRQADALALPFEDAAFDVVVCQFGAMFFPDRIRGFAEARRVLKADGAFLFSVWDRIEANGFADVVSQALVALFPEDPPRFMARTPHGYHDVAAIRDDLAAAGFGDVAIEVRPGTRRAASTAAVAAAFCQGTPMRAEIEARSPGGLEAATAHAAAALARTYGEGPAEAPIQALVVTASP